MSTKKQKLKRSLILQAIEWIGTHPFVTGLMAILGIIGFVFSIFAFRVDQADAARSSAQAERVEGTVTALSSDTRERDEKIQQSLGRIEEGISGAPRDRIPVVAEMTYPEARRKLIDSGWMPSHIRWQDLEYAGMRVLPLRNYGFEELEDCSGTGIGMCKFHFHDAAGNRLSVVTKGAEEGEIDYDRNVFVGTPSFENMRVLSVQLNPDA